MAPLVAGWRASFNSVCRKVAEHDPFTRQVTCCDPKCSYLCTTIEESEALVVPQCTRFCTSCSHKDFCKTILSGKEKAKSLWASAGIFRRRVPNPSVFLQICYFHMNWICLGESDTSERVGTMGRLIKKIEQKT